MTLRQPLDRPNIILINCDDLGYGDLGCYGSTANTTPHLDRMAAEGLRFTSFCQASSVCSPSRGALMTGCYPQRIGFGLFEGRGVLFPGQGVGLNPSEITMARLLKDRGYATSHLGKWHCGDQPAFLPTNHGFDSYFGIPYSNDMGRQVHWSNPPLPLLRNGEVVQVQPDQASLTERYTDEAVRFVRDHAGEPFFLYLAHMYVHTPIYAPWRFLKETRNGPYGAAVACVDWSLGVLRHELARLGIERNTLVMFTSDNGCRCQMGGANHPLRGTKGTSWGGGFCVPFLAAWPGTIAPGECAELLRSVDLLPTLAGLAGALAPADRVIDGTNLRSVLVEGRSQTGDARTMPYYWCNRLEAVRCGHWKLHVLRRELEVCELYDLASDIGEKKNVAKDHPEVVAELRRLAEGFRKEFGDAAQGVPIACERPIGNVDNPRPLTEYDPEYPYAVPLYDLPDCG
jgi:arylsulfatase A-like enzyme